MTQSSQGQSSRRRGAAPTRSFRARSLYLRLLPTSLNTVITLAPTDWTAVMMETAMSEAISAYSIAVTPDSSAANFFMDLNTFLLLLRDPIRRETRFPRRQRGPD